MFMADEKIPHFFKVHGNQGIPHKRNSHIFPAINLSSGQVVDPQPLPGQRDSSGVDMRPINLAYVPKQIIVGTFAFLTYQGALFLWTLTDCHANFEKRCVVLQSDVCWGSPILASDIFQICLDNRAFMIHVIFIHIYHVASIVIFWVQTFLNWTPMFSFVFFEHGQHEFLCSNFNVVCSPHVKTIPKVFFASTSLIQWNPRSEEVAGKRRIYIYIYIYLYIIIYIYIYIRIITINI